MRCHSHRCPGCLRSIACEGPCPILTGERACRACGGEPPRVAFHILVATAPKLPGWMIQRDPRGVVAFYYSGQLVSPEAVPSAIRGELAIALARVAGPR